VSRYFFFPVFIILPSFPPSCCFAHMLRLVEENYYYYFYLARAERTCRASCLFALKCMFAYTATN
jgi:hypothetical protein